MAYIQRRLLVRDDQGDEKEVLDKDFFEIDAPLIVLGEPGSGKSDLVAEFKKQTESPFYTASSLEAYPEIIQPNKPARTIIDGVDEITAYGKGVGISRVIKALRYHKEPNFVLTCRAVDWQAAANNQIIQNRWHKETVAGKLLPLNESEVLQFVELYGEGVSGDDFINMAQEKDIYELLKNPQTLIMLLKAIKRDGWPDTKTSLFRSACRELAEEQNKIHASLQRNSVNSSQILETAGFIFAQMLLSGANILLIDGVSEAGAPSIASLVGLEFDDQNIHNTLSTKLFRPSGEGLIAPAHRTVAEFLAAEWLAQRLRGQLSLRRVETLLYGPGFVVPSALRGLHAWLATLSPTHSQKLIERDPYGFLRYGDAAEISVPHSKGLLEALKDMAELDPYFRSEDWFSTLGKGLARQELSEELLSLICNPSTPYQLSHLIIESIRGSELVGSISGELLSIVMSTTPTEMERRAALRTLLESSVDVDWVDVVDSLKNQSSAASVTLAVEIVEKNAQMFSVSKVVETLVMLDRFVKRAGYTRIYGIGYDLEKSLSVEQLEGCLNKISGNEIEDDIEDEDSGSLSDWVYRFSLELLSRGYKPDACVFYSWFKNIKRFGSRRSSWDKKSKEYFEKETELRRALQSEVLKGSHYTRLHRVADLFPGAWMKEEDLIFQMENILQRRESIEDWPICWRNLVHFGNMHRDFSENFLKEARIQAKGHPELERELEVLRPSLEYDFEKEEEERRKRRDEERLVEAKKRHDDFSRFQDEFFEGNNLRDIAQIARAYLGHFSTDLGDDPEPLARVEELVGKENLEMAIRSVEAAVENNEIPSPRKIAELHANESKEYFLELILIVYSDMFLKQRQSLSEMPEEIIKSSLASCHWRLGSVDNLKNEIEKKLAEIVFSDARSKEQFIRDTIEPYLNKGFEHVSGLWQLSNHEEFSDIAGSLAIEWIENFPQMSNRSLEELVEIAIKYGRRKDVVRIANIRVLALDGASDIDLGNIWLGVLFLLDFQTNRDLLEVFANEENENIWVFRDIIGKNVKGVAEWPNLDEYQDHFLVSQYGSVWPSSETPLGVRTGDRNEWDASQFISGRIKNLGLNMSNDATSLLQDLVESEVETGYEKFTKHILAQHVRQKAEGNKLKPTLVDVKSVLQQQAPANHDDLQAIIMDHLNDLQDRIRSSSTSEIDIFWQGEAPHDENYCRNRIVSSLNLVLERYGIRTYIEGAMPAETRCDILNTFDKTDVPIEVKGQWHSSLWTAASDQLQNYTKAYNAKGRGIYMVLWFGYLGPKHPKNPHGWHGQEMPRTKEEMEALLLERYEGLSEKTKIFVLDLSR